MRKKNEKIIFRLHNCKRTSCLEDINEITISGITILSKREKFGGVCLHKGNQRKFGYKINIKGKIYPVAGSHSYPIIAFKGKFLDIELENFPRYPSFGQDKYAARNVLNGYSAVESFPTWTEYREFEFLKAES